MKLLRTFPPTLNPPKRLPEGICKVLILGRIMSLPTYVGLESVTLSQKVG